jgi:ABC-type multidrug transport system fused ATPase/permease subunit
MLTLTLSLPHTHSHTHSHRVEDASVGFRDASVSAVKITAAYVPILRMCVAVGFAGVVWFGSYSILQGKVSDCACDYV